MSKFAVFDIDGTIFRSSLYIEIVYELARQQTIDLPKNKHDKAYSGWLTRRDKGYDNYRNKMVEFMESQLKGMEVADFERAADTVVANQADHVYVYTRRLIKNLKDEGYFLIALSGSQTQLVERFAQKWQFDDFVGQVYEQKNGVFTGQSSKSHKDKELLVEPLIVMNSLTWRDSIAVGDTEGDITLLKKADRAIAFNPNRALYRTAVESGWEIIVERKDMIYKFEPGKTRNYELIDTE